MKTVPKSGFWCALVAILVLGAIAGVGMWLRPASIEPVLQRIVEAIAVLGGLYVNGRLNRDVREKLSGKGTDERE